MSASIHVLDRADRHVGLELDRHVVGIRAMHDQRVAGQRHDLAADPGRRRLCRRVEGHRRGHHGDAVATGRLNRISNVIVSPGWISSSRSTGGEPRRIARRADRRPPSIRRSGTGGFACRRNMPAKRHGATGATRASIAQLPSNSRGPHPRRPGRRARSGRLDRAVGGAVIVCSIFIASSTSSGAPFSTVAPGAATSAITLPGIGAFSPPSTSSPAPPRLAGRPRSGSCLRVDEHVAPHAVRDDGRLDAPA